MKKKNKVISGCLMVSLLPLAGDSMAFNLGEALGQLQNSVREQKSQSQTSSNKVSPSASAQTEPSKVDDGPCNNNARNVGAIVGGLAGLFLAKDNNDPLAKVVAVGIGGLVGGAIGSEIDRRECELARIQKKYGLEMEVTRLADSGDASSTDGATGATINSNTTGKQDVGLSVSVIDQEGKPQFDAGSAVILPATKEHFSELAKQYVTSDQLRKQAEGKTDEQKENIYKELKKKRILLVGHTDDTGDSKLNAKLSEERAKEVARVFKSAGVGEDQLYYQGAGETLPIADNKTDAGRAKNRRVEIVDLSNEDKFQQYLQSRRPKITYYRPAQVAKAVTPSAVTSEKPVESNPPTNLTASFVDFGGVPLAASNSTPNIGKVSGVDSGFSLISSAHADAGPILSCDQDRPRSVGAVKSLQSEATYAGREYMPGTYDSSWVANANGHLVTLTHVAVLRDGAVPVGKPSLAVYRDFKGGGKTKPTSIEPVEVNVYQGNKAMLYRAFGKGSVRCVDMVIPNKSPMSAPDSKIIYQNTSGLYVAAFDVRVIQ